MDKNKVLFISGPNLNLLGKREPNIYGTSSLQEIHKNLENLALEANLILSCRQSNSESEIISWIHSAQKDFQAIVINPAAYTHTSVSIRDSLIIYKGIIIEIHISNPYKREDFRHKSFISGVSSGIIAGFGEKSYYLALNAVKILLTEDKLNENN